METRDIALIKALSNGAGGASYTLPTASATVLGGVQPVAKTDAMTQSVGVDENGGLWAPAGSGGGSGGSGFQKVVDFTTEEAVTEFSTPTLTKAQADAIASASVLNIVLDIPRDTSDETISTVGTVDLYYYSAWLSKFVNKLSAIPAPSVTYSNYRVSMLTVLKNPKAIEGLRAQPCAIIASGYNHNINAPTPSILGSGEAFLWGYEKSYFKVSGSQTMAAGTRFIVEVVA